MSEPKHKSLWPGVTPPPGEGWKFTYKDQQVFDWVWPTSSVRSTVLSLKKEKTNFRDEGQPSVYPSPERPCWHPVLNVSPQNHHKWTSAVYIAQSVAFFNGNLGRRRQYHLILSSSPSHGYFPKSLCVIPKLGLPRWHLPANAEVRNAGSDPQSGRAHGRWHSSPL